MEREVDTEGDTDNIDRACVCVCVRALSWSRVSQTGNSRTMLRSDRCQRASALSRDLRRMSKAGVPLAPSLLYTATRRLFRKDSLGVT